MTCPVYAAMILGARREPFLGACLESLAGSVDHLAVDVNGDCPENLADLEASLLAREGRVRQEFLAFEGFASARNHSLDLLPPGEGWILFVDADEVHYPAGLHAVTRRLLPSLPDDVGVVQAYTIQFMQSFRCFTGIDRRSQFLIRRTPSLRFEGDVHEKFVGFTGRTVTAPYVYGHYGYVRHPGEVLEKWKQYADLGDASYARDELDRAVGEGYLDEEAARCMAFAGPHPEPVEVLRRSLPEHVARFDTLVGEAPAPPRLRQRLRILWRSLPLWRAAGG